MEFDPAIQHAIERLESDERREIERRVQDAGEDPLESKLHQLEQSINDVKRRRGEQPVSVVTSATRGPRAPELIAAIASD